MSSKTPVISASDELKDFAVAFNEVKFKYLFFRFFWQKASYRMRSTRYVCEMPKSDVTHL